MPLLEFSSILVNAKKKKKAFFFSLEAFKGELQLHSGDFCMNRELFRGLFKTKTIMHHCRAEQAISPGIQRILPPL